MIQFLSNNASTFSFVPFARRSIKSAPTEETEMLFT